jgi:hypothetical protein
MDLFFELLFWFGWWFPVETGRIIVRVASFGYARSEDEWLCGTIGVLFMLALTVGVALLFW